MTTKILTVNDTPSAQVISKATASEVIKDEKGRSITLQKPGPLPQFRLIEAIGESAKNDVYVRMTLPLLYVKDIDGEPVEPLTKKGHVEALIQRLDDHGIAAVMKGVDERFGARDPEQDKAVLGN
jgi:hypothetical protein